MTYRDLLAATAETLDLIRREKPNGCGFCHEGICTRPAYCAEALRNPDAAGRCSRCRRNAVANYDPDRERSDPWNKPITECCGAWLVDESDAYDRA